MVILITLFVRIVLDRKMKNIMDTKKINLMILVLIVLTALILPFANAQYKPVAGMLEIPVNQEPLEIKLYVRINSGPVGNNICIINPTVQSALDGSFSTDLNNLVLRDFPSVECDSFWKLGDAIWYEVNLNDKTYASGVETIASGTGLQWLKPLSIPTERENPSLPDGFENNLGGGSGGSGGGREDSALQLPSKNSPSGDITHKPEISTQLLAKQEDGSIEAALTMELLNDVESDIFVRMVLFSLPNNYITNIIEDNFFIENKIKEKYLIDSNNLNPGRYKLQAFVYAQNELIAVSNIESFFIGGKQIENPAKESIVGKAIQESKKVTVNNFVIYILAVIIILLLFVLWIRRRKEKKN